MPRGVRAREAGAVRRSPSAGRSGFTLVEMLVAMAITLVMMAAVVTLFANVSNSVRNRRATIEMSGQLRHLRNVLQADLQGATCPGVTWQRPESNHGYIEIIEGRFREGNASELIDADPATPTNWPPTVLNPEIDHAISVLPSSNLPFAQSPGRSDWATDGAALGDFDDVLMLTSRNEEEPFVGRVPQPQSLRDDDDIRMFHEWKSETIESPLAEVVWFAVENPGYTDDPATGNSDPSADGFFGEPGMRTIYRRTLLIAPWLNPYRDVNPNDDNDPNVFTFEGEDFKATPGLVRLLSDDINRDDPDGLPKALAALVAFQERYDLSVRLEWDPHLGDDGRYKIVANTLGDLTKRENRYEHHSFRPDRDQPAREFPFAALSVGSGYSGNELNVVCYPETESPPYPSQPDRYVSPMRREEGKAHIQNTMVAAYSLNVGFPPPANNPSPVRYKYKWRPFAFVDEDQSDTLATARVILNDDEEVVRIVHGLVPLSGDRRGEDVMMTDVLAFDLRVYDPGAPLFGVRDIPGDASSEIGSILEPTDPGWRLAYNHTDNMGAGTPAIGTGVATYPFAGQGAYVDLGYGFPLRAPKYFLPTYASASMPWFFAPHLQIALSLSQNPPIVVREGGSISDVRGIPLAPGYAVYDTWSFHYENNGVNEDNDEIENGSWQISDGDSNGTPQIDEGINGVDDVGHYANPNPLPLTVSGIRLGVDDVGERETTPPYDKPLRGVQVIVRTYERDSRAIRQARVHQHFMGE